MEFCWWRFKNANNTDEVSIINGEIEGCLMGFGTGGWWCMRGKEEMGKLDKKEKRMGR